MTTRPYKNEIKQRLLSSALFKLAISVLILIPIGIIGFFGYAVFSDIKGVAEIGPAGDFFGGMTTPLLTFLTFMGVLFTIVLQRQELNLTRDELARSANALENQITTLNKQNFESTFFQMLSLLNDIVNSMDTKSAHYSKSTEKKGRDCFDVFLDDLILDFSSLQRSEHIGKIKHDIEGSNGKPLSDEEILATAYEKFWNRNRKDLGHYYRYLFNIVRFVDESGNGESYYMNLLRAQLSDRELVMLFYNALTADGIKFKAYIEKWALLDNIRYDDLLTQVHLEKFNGSAFDSGKASAKRDEEAGKKLVQIESD